MVVGLPDYIPLSLSRLSSYSFHKFLLPFVGLHPLFVSGLKRV